MTFSFEIIAPDTYRLIVMCDDRIVDVLERTDHRGPYVAKIGLFSFLSFRRNNFSFDNAEIDRFLFC